MAMVPVIQAGVLAVYGIIISYLLQKKLDASQEPSLDEGYKYLCAGLAVGVSCFTSGYGMGKFLKQLNNDNWYFVRRGHKDETENASRKMSFVTFVLCLIFLEAIGFYGLIVALYLVGN